ncbi:mitochondrial group I intron splicing factor Ccm1p [[Candida] anglica]
MLYSGARRVTVAAVRPDGRAAGATRSIVVVKKKGAKRSGGDRKDRRTRDGAAAMGPGREESSLQAWVRKDDRSRLDAEERAHRRKMQSLRELTVRVASMVRQREREDRRALSQEEETRASQNLVGPASGPLPAGYVDSESQRVLGLLGGPEGGRRSGDPQAIGLLGQAEGGTTNIGMTTRGSLFTVPAALGIPESIQQRLGLSIRYLVSAKHQNWPMVLQQLAAEGGFKGLPTKDVRQFVRAMPPKQLKNLIPVVQEMCAAGDVEVGQKLVDLFIQALVQGGEVDARAMQEINQWKRHLQRVNKGGRLPRSTYELLVAASGKHGDMTSVNAYLSEMKARGLEPSAETFTNVLTTCVYRAKDHGQAVAIFESMKFLSARTKPTTKNYQDIIVSYVNNDQIEKALDLYQEMKVEKIGMNQPIMVALARGCTTRVELRMKAWEFMFEIYERRWDPTVETVEYLMYLAANDGDLALVRALYRKMNESQDVTERAFSFLMLGYGKSAEDGEMPGITFNERGRVFRRNILDEAEREIFHGGDEKGSNDPAKNIPFLPLVTLQSAAQRVAESSAMWAHTLIFNGRLINDKNTDMYLKVAIEHGEMGDFMERYEGSTELDREGIPGSREVAESETEASASVEDSEIVEEESEVAEIVEEESESAEVVEETESAEAGEKPVIEEDISEVSETSYIMEELEEPTQSLSTPRSSLTSPLLPLSTNKVARSTRIYQTALSAAARFNSFEFAQTVWQERGQFRKSTVFSRLPIRERDAQDFSFAQSMVRSLTRMGMLTDAMAVVVSTEYQFKWSWKELSELYHSALEVGDERITQTCKGISGRALAKHEGRIRRKDYKRYVMERGY